MASQFIGLSVLITLNHPPNVLVQGLVANVVEETSTLILEDVHFPADGRRMPTCGVEGSQIADIQIVEPAPPPNASQAPTGSNVQKTVQSRGTVAGNAIAAGSAPYAPSQTPMGALAAQTAQELTDPAIVSTTRPTPRTSQTRSTAASLTNTAAYGIPAVRSRGSQGPPAQQTPSASGAGKKRNDPATLTAPFSNLNIENSQNLEADESDETLPATGNVVGSAVRRVSITKTRNGRPMDEVPSGYDKKRRTKKGNRKKEQQVSQDYGVLETSPEAVRKTARAQAQTQGQGQNQFRGKGWRQTPMLQEAGAPAQKTPGIISGKVGQQAVRSERRKAKRQRALEAKSGWATEDATDIQDLPEFDFAENLSKSDKRQVFDQIRNEDTTADEDRLVSFNRLPQARPGTYGGKNLHPTENVLDGPARGGLRRGSLSDSSFDSFDIDSGHNSRRAQSRASHKRNPLTNSGILGEEAATHSSGHSAAGLRSRVHIGLGIPRSSLPHSHNSPNPNASGVRYTPPTSPSFERQNSSSAIQAHFRTATSNRTCSTITPGVMVAVEEIAEVDFGLPPEILTENAGRGIAEVALAAVNPGGRRLARENMALNSRPLCVVLAGNHKAGARAVAAARHLAGRGLRIVVCVLGLERGVVHLEKEVRSQVDMIQRMGGASVAVRAWADVKRLVLVPRHDEQHQQPQMAPVELVLDSLLAPPRTFDALGLEDQKVAGEMISWVAERAGRGMVVVSVDVPSGMSGSTGEISHNHPTTKTPLFVPARHIACIGGPRVGLLRALQRQHLASASSLATPVAATSSSAAASVSVDPPVRLDWALWAVDVGINRAWKQFGGVGAGGAGAGGSAAAGTRGVRFGTEWVVPLTFVAEGDLLMG